MADIFPQKLSRMTLQVFKTPGAFHNNNITSLYVLNIIVF